MIEKMQFVSITGPQSEIDRVMDQYLSHYEIHLENALTELSGVADLKPFIAVNPYRETLARSRELMAMTDSPTETAVSSVSIETALETINRISQKLTPFREEDEALRNEKAALTNSLGQILPFQNLDADIHTLLGFHTIKYRFGRIAINYAEKFQQYVYDNISTIFYESSKDQDYIWGVYFTPAGDAAGIDAVFQSMHFERVYLPDNYTGTPSESIADLQNRIQTVDAKLETCAQNRKKVLTEESAALAAAAARLEAHSKNFDIRKLAACTNNAKSFFIICGWMSKADAKLLLEDIGQDTQIYCILENDEEKRNSVPPTRLKNAKLFKPFEMYIRMYGLPAYNELDPTKFVALTYAFIFGWMFGDVGQGLCLAVGGFLLYHYKKVDLAGIIGYAGIFSTIFGFLFGSFFGFEDVLPALWMRPVNAMSTLPFLGKLNTVFVAAIAFGMGLILLTMVFHIINGIKAKDVENTFFDTNGVAGLVFYGSLVLIIVLFMTGNPLPAGILLVILFVVPLILIAFKEPITQKLLKQKEENPTGPVMLIVQAFFELFEVLLSYFSNTLSFVRVGAFAVSHAAMMEVVLMLAGAESGSPSWVVVILGNLFVMGMEGLIVGIQVLRLEYYEMFSRFYKGTGREFKPFSKQK